MIAESWILEALGQINIDSATDEASRRRIQKALNLTTERCVDEEKLRFVANAFELEVFALLEKDQDTLRTAAENAFQISRTLDDPPDPIATAENLIRLSCLGVIGDRSPDVRRLLSERDWPNLPLESVDWGTRVWSGILDMWLRLFRKKGWEDLRAVQGRIATLRKDQQECEPQFLDRAEKRREQRAAWELVCAYHLAKAAEVMGTFLVQGSVDGHYDIREQLEAQFDRAIDAAIQGQLMERENLARLLARTAQVLVGNSIWTVTRAVNSRVTRFVEKLVGDPVRPILEMLPPQRRTLREEGLLGSGRRSVVVSLPTSSGKTFIAEFRILEALNQFDTDRGWVAYLAPTRALVNQVTRELQGKFGPLNIVVEKVSPALEIDGLEAGMLTEKDPKREFRILVTTPEKLDLMVRSGWEARIGRPLTLVVVDEAHGIAAGDRGLKLELLLATINRECRDAQFLLLTPFIHNGEEIARWLSPESHENIELGLEWVPNDRVVAIARPVRGEKRGDFKIELSTVHTNRKTLTIPESLSLNEIRPLGLPWGEVSRYPGKLAAAAAHLLRRRGPVIVLVGQPGHSWAVADRLMVEEYRGESTNPDLEHIQRFLADEMGEDFPLGRMLEYGVAVHHTGLSEDTRALVEWMTEKGMINALVATTTIAQGVNFPVSGVVFASHQYPYGQMMPPEDFWNIVGRAGRVGQGDLGIIALAAHSRERETELEEFVARSVLALNSTLIDMVLELEEQGKLLNLESLAWEPRWSAFLQYLAHTYRQIGDHERFAAEVEQVLRGTLGFQELRRSHRHVANALVQGVYNYAERIKGKPLKLVDLTGFSWESVSGTLSRLSEARITRDVWSPDLFKSRRHDLQRMMGILLQVPELRTQLSEVTGGSQPDGDKLARILSDWVQGRSLTEMAHEYFMKDEGGERSETDRIDAMTTCCRSIFGRLTQTASWGLSALQALTFGDEFDELSSEDQQTLRNLPARVYYGVNSDEAVALRLLGVPRMAASELSRVLELVASESLHQIREKLKGASPQVWISALGNQRGESYYRVWSIIHDEL